MNYSDIKHRFANKLEGKNGCVRSGNVRYEGRNFYSYGTVFGQWLDISRNVVAIFDGSTSPSSSKHKLWKGLFPDDVHVFPLDFGSSSYYGWRNCDLVAWNFKDEDFKEHHRMLMIDHYVERIYDQLAAIKDGKKKGLENVDFKAWDYITELCSLYKDTSVAKWLAYSSVKENREVSKYTDKKSYAKEIAKIRATAKQQRKLAKLLKTGERNVEVLTDALFGEGTYKTYWDYCARFRKAADKRAKVEALCERLGIASPYESYSRGSMDTGLTADQIRRLTAKERVELHFKALAHKEYEEHEDERKKKYNKNFRNAYAWIVGREPKVESQWSGRLSKDVKKVRNMYTGDEYIVSEDGYRSTSRLWGMKLHVSFDYDEFRSSSDKEEWIRNFYAECIEVDRNLHALHIFDRFGDAVYTDQLIDYSTYRIYVINDVLREGTTEKELAICEDFVNRWNAILHDKQVRYRAEQMERERLKEEERKEREYMEQVKREQIDEYIKEGTEGCRNLWRKHLTSINESEERYYEVAFNSDGDFFYNGNVLLRLNLNKDKVETSKYIKIPVETCKKMWKIVSKWHENPSCFKPMEIDTKGSGRYTISSYENDILTAGCHKIAYAEMERMYNEIINA